MELAALLQPAQTSAQHDRKNKINQYFQSRCYTGKRRSDREGKEIGRQGERGRERERERVRERERKKDLRPLKSVVDVCRIGHEGQHPES